jgi:MFS family permease
VSRDLATEARLPSRIVVLGLVSLLTAISSAMILGLLPVFLVTVLGVSMVLLGVIEGLAGAGLSVAKVIAGPISDWLGRRKPLLLLGYGTSALVKLVFPLADNAISVLVARALDRVGKGLRDAPRDAFVADITHRSIRGSSFGLRAALYTLGFVIGPLAATWLMLSSGDNFRLVFWVAVVPAVAGIALLAWGVKETAEDHSARPLRRFDRAQLAKLTAPFWWIVAIAGMFSLARFSQAFPVLKAHELGVQAALLPGIIAIMHVVYSIVAYPSGVLADRISARIQLAVTGVVLVLTDVILALAETLWMVALGAALWGLQMGLSYGLLKAAVADVAPKELSGTAFGIYDCAVGITTFVASAAAGIIWSRGGSTITFAMGAILAAGALVLVHIWPTPRTAAS